MKINKLEVNYRHHPKLEEHFVIEVENKVEVTGSGKKAEKKVFEIFEVEGNKLKLRISKDTAIQLAQFIDSNTEF